ncbi:MAG: hypothetical protein ACKVTZ_13280 [Bacteroidia bacterium]
MIKLYRTRTDTAILAKYRGKKRVLYNLELLKQKQEILKGLKPTFTLKKMWGEAKVQLILGSPSNVMLTKTCSGCFSCRKSAKTKFLQVIGQLKQPVQHYIYATT